MRALALVPLLLLAPAGSAQPAKPFVEHDAWEVEVFEGRAQVRERLSYVGPGGSVEVWAPAAARDVQAFVEGPEGPRAVPWSWAGPGALRVAIGGEASGAWATTRLLLAYTVPAGSTGLRLELQGPPPRERATLVARLPAGWEARAGGEPLEEREPGLWVAAWESPRVPAFVALAPAPGPSPLPLLGALLALVLAGTMTRAWRARGKPKPAQMSLLDHLRELQARLRVALLAVAVLMLAFFSLALEPVRLGGAPVPLPLPSVGDNVAAQTFRLIAQQVVPPGVELVVLNPVSGALVLVEVALLLAVLVASPLLGYEAGAFLMPALLPPERRLLLGAIPVVTGLFLAGALFAYLVMVPGMLRVLYGYAFALGAAPLLSLDSLVSFAVLVTLLFGLAFELPVLMVALAKLGVATPRGMAMRWRHAVVGLFLLAALITPDPTVVSQVLVALPMLGLYLLGLVAARLAVRAPAAGAAGAASAAGR